MFVAKKIKQWYYKSIKYYKLVIIYMAVSPARYLDEATLKLEYLIVAINEKRMEVYGNFYQPNGIYYG